MKVQCDLTSIRVLLQIPEEEPETSTSHQSQDAVAVSGVPISKATQAFMHTCVLHLPFSKWHVAFHGTDDTGMGHIFNSDLRLLKAGGVASASSTSKDVAAESGASTQRPNNLACSCGAQRAVCSVQCMTSLHALHKHTLEHTHGCINAQMHKMGSLHRSRRQCG